MEKFPIIITLGGMLLGWIAGQMAYTDPALKGLVPASTPLEYACAAAGAILVLGLGKLMALRSAAAAKV